MASRLSLEGTRLTRSFGSGDTLTVALHEVSIKLYSGEFCLVMGPSGCGKSTLLAVLSGLLRPNSGEVIVLGEDLWQMSDSERREFRLRHFGFIFQGYNLFPILTAKEQLAMILRWGEAAMPPDAESRAMETLEYLGMTQKANLLPRELSGGEQQRVAIARALIKKPELCFADEPTSALDWGSGRQVIESLQEAAHGRGATVLVVAHDARILPYADRVIHLEDGFITEQSTQPQEMLSQSS